MKNNQEKYQELINEINWENWEKEREQCDEQIEYFDLCEVLNNRLNWLVEDINITDEHFDTIKEIQILLALLNEEKIKRIL